jgi:hypothetical protein
MAFYVVTIRGTNSADVVVEAANRQDAQLIATRAAETSMLPPGRVVRRESSTALVTTPQRVEADFAISSTIETLP